MKNLYVKSPLVEVTEGKIEGKKISLKMDTAQPSGSFKIRGMQFACLAAVENGAKKFLSSSGGNAGLAVSYAGYKLGVPVTVVLPVTTPATVIKKLESFGSTVIVNGAAWDEAHAYCLELCENDKEFAYIPPFDDAKLWEGHSTIVDELVEQCDSQPDLIILSVGGDGLMNGVVEGLIRNNWEDTDVLAVETYGADSLYQTAEAGELITLDDITSIAKSLGAKQVAQKTLDNVKNYNVIPYRVTDKSAALACVELANTYRVLVEPACGASASVVFENMDVLEQYENIVVIVCGGSNVNIEMINKWSAEYAE